MNCSDVRRSGIGCGLCRNPSRKNCRCERNGITPFFNRRFWKTVVDADIAEDDEDDAGNSTASLWVGEKSRADTEN